MAGGARAVPCCCCGCRRPRGQAEALCWKGDRAKAPRPTCDLAFTLPEAGPWGPCQRVPGLCQDRGRGAVSKGPSAPGKGLSTAFYSDRG